MSVRKAFSVLKSSCARRGGIFPLLACIAAPALLPASSAQASGNIDLGDGRSISLGAGMRASYSNLDPGTPGGGAASSFNLDSARLYISGQAKSWLKVTSNFERNANGDVELLDGYVQFEPAKEFNVWIGRMLPPSDRSNLDGPYYLSTWLYPDVVSRYPAKFAGRDDGATVWGKLLSEKLVYALGVFNGHDRVVGASNEADNPLYAGRLAYNILAPEPDPAYYTSSTYYGKADVLTVAFATQYQKRGVGTALAPGDYFGWNFDVLYEKNLAGNGVVTLEGAYYRYNTDGVRDGSSGFAGSGPVANVGGLVEGNAFLLGTDYMFPAEIGIGHVQPALRYQEFDPDLGVAVTRQYDIGVNYILDGHNARICADFANAITGHVSQKQFVLGVQVQI
jgi:hypothetical protein